MSRKKMTITFSEEVAEELKEMAESQGLSMNEVLRRALATEKYLLQAVRSGHRVLIRDEASKETRELVLR